MLFLAFPLLWLLSVSFKGPRELVELHPHLIPSQPTLANYRDALEHEIGDSLARARGTAEGRRR